ncbi:MAG: cellulase family glycosylhydrolase [Muribaculaceae bacterium]|nr:cellulase family glycosylhydrolase [Muribaculaceae bacterium]
MAAGCGGGQASVEDNSAAEFVTVGADGRFHRGDSVYRFEGANFWAAPILASEGQGGDRDRLHRELDRLQERGVSNLRVLVGAQSRKRGECLLKPQLVTAPGVYNDTLLAGLDYLMAELERRDMTAVLYLNNAWEWSGGYGSFIEWAGGGDNILPNIDGYREYCDYAAGFLRNDSAKALFADYVADIVPRYASSPALMSWQICNEPRPYGRTEEQTELFVDWIASTARLIKELDPNHMVSTGSEGYVGCEMSLDLWERIHALPEVDYATIHIWPTNWGWVARHEATDSVERAIAMTDEYITEHSAVARRLGKPLVLEEFGYPRDNQSIDPADPTTARDAYYSHIIGAFRSDSLTLSGYNFWAWGGEGTPGVTYTGDPAHEPQGLFSVFATDKAY